MERRDVTIDYIANKKIIRKHYKQFYAHKFDNLEKDEPIT